MNPHASEAKLFSACFLSCHLCAFLGFSKHHRFHLCAGSTEVFYLIVCLSVFVDTRAHVCVYVGTHVYVYVKVWGQLLVTFLSTINPFWDTVSYWPERLGWLARESHGSLCVWFFRSEITHTWFLKSVDSGDRTSVLRLSRLARYHLSYFPPPHPRVTYLIYLEAHIEPSQNKDTPNDGLKEKYWYLYFRLSWVGNGVFTSKNMSKGQVEPYETLSWYGTTCDNYTWWYGIRGQPCGYTHCW